MEKDMGMGESGVAKKKEEELNEKPDRESGIEGKVVVY